MLQEAKQICYDQAQHAIHLIFWTREMASKWSAEFTSISFRNRRFPIRNVHNEQIFLQIKNNVWGRQIGADGIRNESPRERYHVRLLNFSRYMDEAAIDSYIQGKFSRTQLKKHLREISRSTSALDSRLETKYWGTTTTLRLLTKLLDRKVFVVLTRNGAENASYQIFEPAEVKIEGVTFSSAKERNYCSGKPNAWMKELQRASKAGQEDNQSPIVLHYNGNHYSQLKFEVTQAVWGEKEENDEGSMEVDGASEEAYDVLQDQNGNEEQETEDANMEDARATTSTLQEHEREDIKQFGGNRKHGLLAFPTAGLAGIAPGKHKNTERSGSILARYGSDLGKRIRSITGNDRKMARGVKVYWSDLNEHDVPI
ncbi:hypothetical protein PHMEG_00011988 [Phytophthora megakarya]|uniref:Uncharacterized protein n=1 Tax=Phytophthora megakarya TaxID=4795 RepID=A0A225WBB0_9STRA|nr:hypothetical protein PHMEG_00011988 [Phytophthora megakarya]